MGSLDLTDILKLHITSQTDCNFYVSVCYFFFQNFSPQMSGGYDDKSPAMPVPGPMVGQKQTHTDKTAVALSVIVMQCLTLPLFD